MSRKFTSFPIKKQNSLVESSTKNSEITLKGGRRIPLQKQFSIDVPNSNRFNDKPSPNSNNNNNNNNQSVLSDCTDNNFKSLSIFGIKNQTDRSAASKFDVKIRDRQKSITYRRDERVNLNIFLNHTIKTNSDTVESESEKETYIPHFKPETIPYNDNDATYTESSDTRQAPQYQVKPIPATKTNRRPLIRARSAPVRPTEDVTKGFQTKRRSKQRKSGKGNADTSKEDNFFEDDELDDDSARKSRCQNKQLNVPSTRVRSSVFGGCDVITLVSLFSSSESESELEEYVSPRKADSCLSINQPPLLRRCGKSVSFQENDLKVITSTTTDFPPMFRRGSIAPLARMIKDKRPPTAPPGTIYLKNESRVTVEMENVEVKPAPVQKKKSEEKDVIEDYPVHCDTPKERDCWKLFKKMLGNGVTVNYDTILRGMLTPTELRTVMGKRVELLNQESEQNENVPG